MHDFFSLFELPPTFAIDSADLEKRYFTIQRMFHPDRLVGKSAGERQQAISRSMLVNEAYETLKNPLKRAQHLLALSGIKPDSVKPSQEMLMETLESREALSEADTMDAIERLAQKNTETQKEALDGLLQAFNDSDMTKAAHLAIRLSYLQKLDDEMRLRRKTLA